MSLIAKGKHNYYLNPSCCLTVLCVITKFPGAPFLRNKFFKTFLKKENSFTIFLAALSKYSIDKVPKIAIFNAVLAKKSRFFVVERVEGAEICHLNVTPNRVHFREFLADVPKRTSDLGELCQKATHLGW